MLPPSWRDYSTLMWHPYSGFVEGTIVPEHKLQHTKVAMDSNFEPDAPVLGQLIHYCYGNSRWDKRAFNRTSPLELPNEPTSPNQGTVLHEILRQIQEAKTFFAAPEVWLAQNSANRFHDLSASILTGQR